jgi:hypothetical protein
MKPTIGTFAVIPRKAQTGFNDPWRDQNSLGTEKDKMNNNRCQNFRLNYDKEKK